METNLTPGPRPAPVTLEGRTVRIEPALEGIAA